MRFAWPLQSLRDEYPLRKRGAQVICASGPPGCISRMETMARAFVINDRCIKDMRCVEACIRRAIHPTPGESGFADAAQLYINPRRCIGCGACAAACLHGAVYAPDEAPAQFSQIGQLNAAWCKL